MYIYRRDFDETKYMCFETKYMYFLIKEEKRF